MFGSHNFYIYIYIYIFFFFFFLLRRYHGRREENDIPKFPFAAGQCKRQAPVPPSLSSSVSTAAFIMAAAEQLCSLLRFVMSSLRASRSPIRAEYIRSSIASKERVGLVDMVDSYLLATSPLGCM